MKISNKSESATIRKVDINIQIKNLKVLIVDDLEIDRMVLAKIILPKMAGLVCKQILYAENGIEAVEVCRNHSDIDLIIMNIQMPKMDGYVATRQIRCFNKGVIIIAHTETAFEYVKDKAKEVGCNDYIRKPIEKVLLVDLIKKYFNK
jgi:CheY-like chemotaxis protein